MTISRIGLGCAVTAASMLGAAHASAVSVIDFEQYNDGDVIGGQIAPGVSLSVDNYTGDWDLGVAWSATAHPKPKLEGLQVPWKTGNLPRNYDPGIGLMIQGIGSVIPRPEAAHAAGEFVFSFDHRLTSFGFDIFDIDGAKEFVSPNGYFVTFFRGDDIVGGITFEDLITPGSQFFDASYAFGNGSANRINLATSDQLGGTFDRVRITLGGSGFIDNVRFSSVPSPAAAGAGLVMAGLSLLRRRSR